MPRKFFLRGLVPFTTVVVLLSTFLTAQAAGKNPNILCIWGDDIGTWNISHYNRGVMG